MRKIGKVGILAVSLMTSIAAAKAPPVPSPPAKPAKPVDESAAVKALSTKLLKAWSTGDRKFIEATISDNFFVGAWDYDMAGRPVEMTQKAQVMKMYDEMMAMMKASGATMKSDFKNYECRASGTLAVCAGNMVGTFMMPNMPPFTMTMRGTDAFEKGPTGWKAIHHHASLAKPIELPSKTMAMTAKTAKYMPETPDGMQVAPLWMNMFTQQMAAIVKANKDIKQARHIHPYALTFSVISGKVITSDENGKDTSYGPGSVVYRAANEPHQTTIKKGAVVFMVTDGPLSNVYLDDKGNPLPTPEAPQK